MSSIVRRVPSPLAQSPAASSSNALVVDRMHRNREILVRCQLSVDVRPAVYLAWRIQPRVWKKGYRLSIFRSASGFSPERYPDDMGRHGQMIAEAHEDSSYIEHPPEGTFFYTFVLHKSRIFGLLEKLSVLRFSETIPSAKVAIGRIEDRILLKELEQRYELGILNHEAGMNEAQVRVLQSQRNLEAAMNPPAPREPHDDLPESVRESIKTNDSVVAAVLAIHRKIESLKADPEFTKLPVKTQRMILGQLKREADAAEIAAKLKMKNG